MKTRYIASVWILMIAFCIAIWGYAIKGFCYKPPEPKLVIELLMEIQEIVDCNLIDGKIGPETKRLVNAQTAKDRPILFNRYAARYMTPSGAPRKDK